MKYKIVSDSTADLLTLPKVDFTSVPLKITVGDVTYVDDECVDLEAIEKHLREFKGRTSTACPSPAEYHAAFGDADRVFCITITSTLSGSFNAAQVAAREYEETYPDRKVFVIDSLSTGPEMALVVYKLEEMITAGMDYEDICRDITNYLAHTRLMFVLHSVRNLANNGRVSPAVAALVGLLGIRIVGRASDHGDLQPMAKCRGDRRALSQLISDMRTLGYRGGKVLIHHCGNLPGAQALKENLAKLFPQAQVLIDRARGLCSFYAEEQGLLVGFEIA
ncbi:MAG: DegV family protein [Clostridia bacterium]|nr:DegV family protein [Clostridia bacterium]